MICRFRLLHTMSTVIKYVFYFILLLYLTLLTLFQSLHVVACHGPIYELLNEFLNYNVNLY